MIFRNLRSYLINANISIKDFSNMINMHPKYISPIASGKKKPGPKLARMIEKFTGGQVRYDNIQSKAKKKYLLEWHPEEYKKDPLMIECDVEEITC